MSTLKELINKIYTELQSTDRIEQYPNLIDKDVVSEIVQNLALIIMPEFVEEKRLEKFVEACEMNYKEETFKKYVTNYSSFLNYIENEFYQGLLVGLAEEG